MKKGIIFLFFLILITVFSVNTVNAGNIIDSDRYVWSENTGWIDFGTSPGNVVVSEDKITGYAYSDGTGWISLNCENDNSCSNIDYGVINNQDSNSLSGHAWSENAGWIDFSNVTLSDEGVFSGYAYSPNIGWLSFSCENTNTCDDINFGLKTSFIREVVVTPPATPPTSTGGGGGGGSSNRLSVSCSVSDRNIAPGSTIEISASSKKGEEPYEYKWSGDVDGIDNFDLAKSSQIIKFEEGGEYKIEVEVIDSKGDDDSDDCPTIKVSERYDVVDNGAVAIPESDLASNESEIENDEYPIDEVIKIILENEDKEVEEIIALILELGPISKPFDQSVTENAKVSNIERDLFVGSTGEDVTKLQEYLNSMGYIVSNSGPGSPGNESNYFGELTRMALSKYQLDNGIQPASGYFGPITRSFIKSKGM